MTTNQQVRQSWQDLADEMIDEPAYHGITIWRPNPCCYKDTLRVEFHARQLDQSWTDIEHARDYLAAMVRTLREYQDRFRVNPNDPTITTESYPCSSCIEAGDVDPGWLAITGETLASLKEAE